MAVADWIEGGKTGGLRFVVAVSVIVKVACRVVLLAQVAEVGGTGDVALYKRAESVVGVI